MVATQLESGLGKRFAEVIDEVAGQGGQETYIQKMGKAPVFYELILLTEYYDSPDRTIAVVESEAEANRLKALAEARLIDRPGWHDSFRSRGTIEVRQISPFVSEELTEDDPEEIVVDLSEIGEDDSEQRVEALNEGQELVLRVSDSGICSSSTWLWSVPLDGLSLVGVGHKVDEHEAPAKPGIAEYRFRPTGQVSGTTELWRVNPRRPRDAHQKLVIRIGEDLLNKA